MDEQGGWLRVTAWVIHLRSVWWVILVALSVSVVTGAGVALERHLHPTIYVAGLRFDAARADEVRLALLALQDQPIRLMSLQGETWHTTPAALGVAIDVDAALERAWAALELPFGARLGMWVNDESTFDVHIPVSAEIDMDRLEAGLLDLSPGLQKEPRDARMYIRDAGIIVDPEVIGFRPDLQETRTQVLRASLNRSQRTAHIILESVRPAIDSKQLASTQPLSLLSEFTTAYDDGPDHAGRANNIELAVKQIDGVVLRPDDSFSLNGQTGPRTEAGGYQSAPVI